MKKSTKIPIYFGTLIIHQNKSLKPIKKKYKLNGDIDKIDACAFTTYSKKGFAKYVMAFTGTCTPGIIAHEVVHIVNMIFKDVEVDLDVYNDEPQAYFTEWVTNQCHKYLKINTIK